LLKSDLKKKHILRSKKDIDVILKSGNRIKSYPILLLYSKETTNEPECRVLFTVSKKKQKSAVRRNRIKRLLKESFRLNKLSLYNHCTEEKVKLNIMCIQLIGDEIPFSTVQKKMISAISKLIQKESNEENI